jgi:hypothetical protein
MDFSMLGEELIEFKFWRSVDHIGPNVNILSYHTATKEKKIKSIYNLIHNTNTTKKKIKT